MRAVSLVVVVLATLIVVGEPAVSAMNAPTVLPHSVAHVMGYMCKGGGRGPVGGSRDADVSEASTNGKWRITNGTAFYSQDPTIGILEYLNLTDCSKSAQTLNRRYVLRGQKAPYTCIWVKE